jgi:tripartite-type tricarboxylate transporter receptor subunit TctC
MTGYFRIGLALAITFLASTALAQYPDRPIRIVVGFAPGGAPDVAGRIFAQELTAALGQPVIVENRTGSGGNIAADQVANARPDGHTLLLGADSQFAINPHLYPKMTDPFKALTPVASLVSNQFYLTVHPSLPIKSFPEFVEHARQADPLLAYGSAGQGTQGHLSMEMLKKRAGINLLHVPYRGAGQAIVAALGGEVQVIMSGSANVPQIASGKLRGLAVTSLKRLEDFPELPAVAEFFPGYELVIWLGLFTTAGTPDQVVLRLRKAIDDVLADSNTVAKLRGLRMRPYKTSPAAFLALMHSDYDKYGRLVSELGVTLE